MTDLAPVYLAAADSALALLRDPAVAAGWTRPSALEGFTVGGLAVHLGSQIRLLTEVRATVKPPIGLLDHYAQAAWVDSGPGSAANRAIVTRNEERAAAGPPALIAETVSALDALRDSLPVAAGAQSTHLPWTGWSLRLDDLLVTRMMELAVHSDDLAVSVGLPTPSLPEEAVDLVLDLLTRLAVRRHGPTAVLRALSRAERAPKVVAAI